DRVEDVRIVAAAAPEHAHRHDLRVERDTGAAVGIAGDRGGGAGDMAAVPAGGVAAVIVARIAGIAVASVAVAGDGGVGDEVVSRQPVGVEVAVADDAGVEHGYHHAAAGGPVPGRGQVQPAGGLVVVPLRRIARIVGGEQRPVDAVDLDVLDARVRGQLAHQGFGVDPVEAAVDADDVGTHRQPSL